ncbi:hypothetical protein EYF80_029714 [Liparis tanakae]|uniref:Uncharacterized protein n=1 Tax=Liparis tanakae TaxID=230148 RepID=A0A4Z2H426_9TELE|nr:hypothetical protein EYF80_029714 [Liparis tanakae]
MTMPRGMSTMAKVQQRTLATFLKPKDTSPGDRDGSRWNEVKSESPVPLNATNTNNGVEVPQPIVLTTGDVMRITKRVSPSRFSLIPNRINEGGSRHDRQRNAHHQTSQV